MDEKFNRPKGFGQILDHTFSLSKKHFKDFFLILLIFFGPIYLLQALIQLASGVSFFREVGAGETWFEQVIMSFDDTEAVNLGADLGVALTGLILIFLAPVATAAVMFAIDHLRKGEEYTVGSVIKQAFSRYWPMLGSTILFCLIGFGLLVVPMIIVTIAGVIGAMVLPVVGVILAILLFVGFSVGAFLLLTRWSFYFGSVVFREETPGLSRSWKLTKGRTWVLFGLFIIFSLIITMISATLELTFGIFLGNSVLLTLIINVVGIITTLIFTVGYAVMYFDLKIRHDADDLKEMIGEYHTPQI
ncbi:MAG TPA: hypothetical protein DEO65_00360 [Bacillus bacterium]|uniref:DUF7847 domain-containing protein n=1 Tax=Siminovitchia fordii TaxID=254759 RepID=A0ABQ4K439_9BACI|nr:hypothetical protein [Siminovitchia fordii]GIN20396.1 hypothetical protein J1TS3_15300 [Siminovitchia fordii]HBZ08317.1 hypothetical protein [Bacillus sp. (in: firmicutes)]